MTIDRDRLMSLEIPREIRRVERRELILYALSVGLGAGEGELGFAWEEALKVVPTVATVLAFDDSWLARAGIPLAGVFHAAQRLDFAGALPPGGDYGVETRIAGLADKGPGKAALILQESRLSLPGAAAPFATGLSTLFVRGGGGCGAAGRELPAPRTPPGRSPDAVIEIATRPDQALLFRLLGDLNPLHVDPGSARAAGFPQPILHGACTFGIACAALLRAACDLDPARLASIEARFAAPVFPGETLAMDLWRAPGEATFRLRAPGRDAVILDAGHAGLAAG